jgi:hypothetical protein
VLAAERIETSHFMKENSILTHGGFDTADERRLLNHQYMDD